MHTRLLTATAALTVVLMALAVPAANAQTTASSSRTSALSVPSLVSASAGDGSYNGLALTPPMGYNDWYQFRCGITEADIVVQADALVSSGLAAKGYDYVNVDDCWQAKTRDAEGNLQANPVTFPHGMKWLADYVHSLGLKFGIYTSAGTRSCGGLPGSYGHYQQDADTFAGWGVDFVKFDWCSPPPNPNIRQMETDMSNALLATGRPIVFSMVTYGGPSWAPSVSNMNYFGANFSSFATVLGNFEGDLKFTDLAAPGHWNDPDTLLVGNTKYNFTVDQQQTQMSLWAELAAPLLISDDLTDLSPDALRILGNSAVIAVDQDPLGRQGHLVAQQGSVDIVAKPLADGNVSLLMVNTGSAAVANASVQAKDIGINPADTGAVALKNLWTGQTTETAGTIAASIPPDGSVMYLVSPGSPTGGAPSSFVNVNAPLAMVVGKPTTVRVSYTDNGRLAAEHVSLGLHANSSEWSIQSASPASWPAVPPGATVAAEYIVTPVGGDLTAGSLTGAATLDWPSSGGTVETDGAATVYLLPPGGLQSLPSLAQAFNSVGITDDSNPGGDLYKGNWSFSAQALAAAGYTPGATIEVGGLPFLWPDVAPGTADNVTGGPTKAIAVSGSGNTLGMLATETSPGADEDGLIIYTDGTADAYSMGMPNWGINANIAGDPGVSTAVAQAYRNYSGGQNQTTVYIDLIKVPINPKKQVAAVILPDDSFFHLFSISVGMPSA